MSDWIEATCIAIGVVICVAVTVLVFWTVADAVWTAVSP